MSQSSLNNPLQIQVQPPKHEQIVTAIWGMIRKGDWAPGSRLPSEQDLAKQFNVAHTTIRKAKIGLAQQGAIVSINRRGTYVCEDALANRIAVIWRGGVLNNNFGYGYRIALDQLEARRSTNMRFQHISATPDMLGDAVALEGLVERIVSMQTSAVVLTADMIGLEELFVSRSIPVVALSYIDHPLVPCVHMDTATMCRLGLSHFENVGCKDVALIGPAEGGASYAKVHRERNWPAHWLATQSWASLTTRREVELFSYESFKAIWGSADARPDGLLVLDDIMLGGVLLAMAELGVQSGRDLQLASHYNSGSDRLITQPFARLEIDPNQYANAIESLLSDQLSGRTPKQFTIEIEPKLIPDAGPSACE